MIIVIKTIQYIGHNRAQHLQNQIRDLRVALIDVQSTL